MNFIKYLILFVFLISPITAFAQDKAPFTALDLIQMKRVSDPVASPNGRYVAFVLRETDMAEDRGRTDIWLVDIHNPDAGPMQLTTHAENDASPKWSKDSQTIYFLSGRSESSQVWRIPLSGGEAAQVTDFPIDVDSFRLSPDNDTLAFTALVFPDCLRLDCTSNRITMEEADPENAIVYDQLIIRFWDKWRDGRRSQLFAVPLENGHVVEEPENLTRGLEVAVPPYPFIGDASYTFTGDSKQIIFSTKLRNANESWSVNTDLYRMRVDGKRRPENLTRNNPASDDQPVISPDGRWLAWLATEGPTRWAAPYKIKLMDLKSGDVKTLAQGWDRSPVQLSFAESSVAIYTLADHIGGRALWEVPLDGSPPVLLSYGIIDQSGQRRLAEFPADGSTPTFQGQRGTISDFTYTDRGFVFARSDLRQPNELYRLDSVMAYQITDVNRDRLAGLEMGDFEQFSFAGAHGDTVYGYVVMPAGYSERRKYPVAFIIHGGPHGSMGNSFHYRWNPQTWAGAGYAVVFIDFHGSTGYGAAFTESVHNDRGGAPLEDLQKGLAAALARFPWMDGERVCALGASYGGYMVNLIQSQWPDRFRCLVNHDGMFDNRMKYFSGDIIGYLEEGFGGQPYFEDPASHERFNPANHVDKWKTPMLVIHSELDYRVPVTHGIAAFTAAQRKGIPSRFIYFPDENHWILKPNNSVQWHREVTRWLDQWLKR